MKVLFWQRKNAANCKGNAPLYVRLTLSGERLEWSTEIQCPIEGWMPKLQKCKGTSVEATTINNRLDAIKARLLLAETKIKLENGVISLSEIRNLSENRQEISHTYQSLCDEFKRIRKESGLYAHNTERSVNVRIGMFLKFLKEIGKQHLRLPQLKTEILYHFQDWCDKQDYSTVVITRAIRQINCVLRFCKDRGIIKEMPELKYRARKQSNREIIFLSEQQIALLEQLETENKYEQQAKALFLWQVYTGMAYQDAQNFRMVNLKKIKGETVIIMPRQKTGETFYVPLFLKAKQLLESWNNKLPKLQNQSYNRILKRLGKQIGFQGKLTTHIARKTAATYWINNGVDYKIVARLLGHKNSSVTEAIYAQVSVHTILKETAHLQKAA
jgi:site-specific recombinase XerD